MRDPFRHRSADQTVQSWRIPGAMVIHTFKDQVKGMVQGVIMCTCLMGPPLGLWALMSLCTIVIRYNLAKPGIKLMLASSSIFNKATLQTKNHTSSYCRSGCILISFSVKSQPKWNYHNRSKPHSEPHDNQNSHEHCCGKIIIHLLYLLVYSMVEFLALNVQKVWINFIYNFI